MKKGDGIFYAEGPGFSRGSDKFSHNQWGGKQNPNKLINEGRGPTKGNNDHKPMNVGPSATKDGYRPVPMCHEPKVQQGKEMFTGHTQVRNPSGTRSWDPQKGQNYKGNPDKINVSGYSMGDGKVVKGSRPVAAGQTDGINYGPKKQY
jgi:hypothetical protein